MGEFMCTTKNHFVHAKFMGECAGSARLLNGSRLQSGHGLISSSLPFLFFQESRPVPECVSCE